MGYSLLSMGQHQKSTALKGLRDVAEREERRNAANKHLKSAERQQSISSVASGAAIGGMVGGPIGAGVGAVAGFVVGELF
ncbi:bacteriocin [Salinivibrio sp. YCSC6]|nr:bacteriocin [Salinivibrio sp. YCSC6]QCF35568.1 bacteriocin [Salinivibrio sp. YCSC6]